MTERLSDKHHRSHNLRLGGGKTYKQTDKQTRATKIKPCRLLPGRGVIGFQWFYGKSLSLRMSLSPARAAAAVAAAVYVSLSSSILLLENTTSGRPAVLSSRVARCACGVAVARRTRSLTA